MDKQALEPKEELAEIQQWSIKKIKNKMNG